MGRRKKPWLCLLLWYALVYAECIYTLAQPPNFKPLPFTTRKLSKAYRESENYDASSPAHLTGLSNGETEHFHNKLHKSLPIVVPDYIDGKSRIGYEKDIMLVLPVKPNATATDTELQMWYTQRPFTAMVDDRGVSKVEHRVDYDTYEDSKVDDDRHPFTNFLIKKMSSKGQKSPLDYGYPESFKFVEDLNGLPSNHKPEWASTDVTDLTSSSSSAATTQSTTASMSPTRNNPFQMFESVKPLDINKYLSPSMMASMPGSEESTTEVKNVTASHIHTIPKRPSKQPSKKPQRIKLTTEPTITEFVQAEPSSSQAVSVDPEQVYAAVRYTTLLKQTNNEFLPSLSHKPKPTLEPISHYQASPTATNVITTTTSPKYTPPPTTTAAATTTTTTTTTAIPNTTTRRTTTFFTTTALPNTITRRITTSARTTTTTTTTSAPTTSSTTTTPAPSSLNDIAIYNVTEDVDDDVPMLTKLPDTTPSENLNNFKIQINQFEPPKGMDFFKPDDPSIELNSFQDISPNISSDMLTNDMKNMLVALGIIKSEQISTTSTTEKPFVKKEPVTPNIDANSYTSFKKIPIDGKQQDKNGISDDMKDLLASFGLLPKKTTENDSTVNRISRQQNLTQVNLDEFDINTNASVNFTDIKTNLSSNFISKGSQSNSDFEADLADFFDNDKSTNKNNSLNSNKPANNDKPMTLNSEMFTDDMKNTLETLGFLKQSSIQNRSPKSAHVFQPTSQLEKLNQDDAAKKITDVLRTIKSLSVKTEANNITAEDLEKQLQTITNTLESDSFNDVNETLLLDILSDDANLKLIESIDNMTSKFRPANQTWPVPDSETTTFKIIRNTKTSTEPATTTLKIISKTKTSTEPATTTFKILPKTKTSTEPVTTTIKIPPKTSTEPATTIKTTTTTIKIPPKTSTESATTIKTTPRNKTSIATTDEAMQSIEPSDSNRVQVQMKPPNPLSTDELLLLYEMGKNEIKRQQPNSTSTSETSDSASTTITSSIDDTSIPGANTEIFSINTDQPNVLETSSTSSTTSTTTSNPTSSEINDPKALANNNAPINDLADSFGAGGVASEEPTADDLPTPKPNGLYFYLDWNTFLNVGEEDKRPIRIRFAPRAGNARNFLPITVP